MRVLAWPAKTPWNPYTSLVYSHVGQKVQVDAWPGNMLRKYSVWHVHWPDALLNIRNPLHAGFKLCGMFAATDFLRRRGTKLIWTMHNLASHEALHAHLEAWFWRQFIPRVDGAISLSSVGLSAALQKFPRLRHVPTTVIHHGHYRDQYSSANGDARSLLGIPERAKVLLFFGAIRAYKNVELLMKAFHELADDEAILYVAGQPNSSQLAGKIAHEAALDSRVRLKMEFVDPKQVSTLLACADVVVLPYREVLNSGSALLALSCNRPVLVPELGAMGELKLNFSSEWVQTFQGPVNAAILRNALQWAKERRPAVCPMPEKYCWDRIGAETVEFYERVVTSRCERRVNLPLARWEANK